MRLGADARARLGMLLVAAMVVSPDALAGSDGAVPTAPGVVAALVVPGTPAPPASETPAPHVPFVPLVLLELFRALVPAAPRVPPGRSAAEAKQEPPAGRVSIAPPHPPSIQMATLPEVDVLKAITTRQQELLACRRRAQKVDLDPELRKVHLHLEVDAAGKVTAVHTDTDSPRLASCLAVVAGHLQFQASDQPAMADADLQF